MRECASARVSTERTAVDGDVQTLSEAEAEAEADPLQPGDGSVVKIEGVLDRIREADDVNWSSGQWSVVHASNGRW